MIKHIRMFCLLSLKVSMSMITKFIFVVNL